MTEVKNIIIVSDGTGATARRVLDSVLSQYQDKPINFSVIKTYQAIRTKEQIDKLLKKIAKDSLVVFSLVSEDINIYFHQQLDARDIMNINILEPMMQTLWQFIGVPVDYQPGLLQEIDDRYYKRIDAIGFTAEHDDGRGYRIDEADLVLVGVSRTCKTPLSMFTTSNYGLKVANIPIVPEEEMKKHLLDRLKNVDSKKIFGLIMQPYALQKLRDERADILESASRQYLQLDNYRDLKNIRDELIFAKRMYAEQGWEAIDVTRRAIEEISKELIRKLGHIS